MFWTKCWPSPFLLRKQMKCMQGAGSLSIHLVCEICSYYLSLSKFLWSTPSRVSHFFNFSSPDSSKCCACQEYPFWVFFFFLTVQCTKLNVNTLISPQWIKTKSVKLQRRHESSFENRTVTWLHYFFSDCLCLVTCDFNLHLISCFDYYTIFTQRL